MKKQWWSYTIAIAALLTAIVLDMYNPYFVGQIIDRAILAGDMPYLRIALLALVGVTIKLQGQYYTLYTSQFKSLHDEEAS